MRTVTRAALVTAAAVLRRSLDLTSCSWRLAVSLDKLRADVG